MNEHAVDWTALEIGVVVAGVVLVALVRLGGGFGLADDGSDAPERKTQTRAVPLAGGPALYAAAIVLILWPGAGGARAVLPWSVEDAWSFDRDALVLALTIGFATGLVDDVRRAGLAPAAKLAGQFAAAAALASGLEAAGATPTFVERALVVLGAVAAQNVANTFDHADGALGSVAFAGFAGAGSSFAGAIAAFLGFNLARRDAGGPPYAYLGDSGSHLIGLLLATSSVGHAALTLPALDLARVVALRVRAGDPVWRGDTRHLGQRLRAAGRGPLAVVALVLACAAPAFALTALSARAFPNAAPWVGALLGAAGCALALALVLRFHPERATPRAL